MVPRLLLEDHQPSHAQKGQIRYRYYLARSVLNGSASSSSPIRRIAAPGIETVVLSSLRDRFPLEAATPDSDVVAAHLKQVSVHADRLELEFVGQDDPVVVLWRPTTAQRRRDIIAPPGRERDKLRPMKAEDRTPILQALAKAWGWMRELTEDRIHGTHALATRERITERSIRMMLSLAQLAPSVVRAIVDGRLPRGIGVGIGIRDLVDLPSSWTEQKRALGIV